MIDFFISYSTSDKAWAEWIAWTLEETGYTTELQAWDFLPGENFILRMQNAAQRAKRTLIVLSKSFANAKFAQPEWAAAMSQDPDAVGRRLIPIRVDDVQPEGLLRALIYLDLFGLDAAAAKPRLIERVGDVERLKPTEPPPFPGQPTAHNQAPFPGQQPQSRASRLPLPKVQRRWNDVEKRQAMRAAFASLATSFKAALVGLQDRNPGVHADFDQIDARKFRCAIAIGGDDRGTCRIWLGSAFGGGEDQICYSEVSESGINEAIGAKDDASASEPRFKLIFGDIHSAEGITNRTG